MKLPYDPNNLTDMIAKTQDPADLDFEMLWALAAENAEDQADEDGYGNPMPESSLPDGAKLPDWLE